MRKKKEKWVLLRNGADYETLSREFKLDPVILRVARNRGLQTNEEFRSFFYPSLSDLNDPKLLKDAVKAAEIISEKIKNIRGCFIQFNNCIISLFILINNYFS